MTWTVNESAQPPLALRCKARSEAARLRDHPTATRTGAAAARAACAEAETAWARGGLPGRKPAWERGRAAAVLAHASASSTRGTEQPPKKAQCKKHWRESA